MTINPSKESWSSDGDWILDDNGNYLFEIVRSDEEGKCREDIEGLTRLAEDAPLMATYLHQLCGVIRVAAVAGDINLRSMPHIHSLVMASEDLFTDMEEVDFDG